MTVRRVRGSETCREEGRVDSLVGSSHDAAALAGSTAAQARSEHGSSIAASMACSSTPLSSAGLLESGWK